MMNPLSHRVLALSRLVAAAWLLTGCPEPVVPSPSVDAGSFEPFGGEARCPEVPCVGGAVCLKGQCFSVNCGGTTCGEGRVCDGSRCVESACAGVVCRFGSCIAGQCPTCSPGAFIASDGGCLAKRGAGEGCGADGECVTGHCVEGVCCGTACDRACQRCDRSGQCAARASLDPGKAGACFPGVCPGSSSECTLDCLTDSFCADGGVCVGGRCEAKRPLGVSCTRGGECGSGQCVDGDCCESACTQPCGQCAEPDGGHLHGLCSAVAKGTASLACGRYRCDGNQVDCPSSCTVDADCTATSFCAQGSCVQKLTAPAACTRDSQCALGRCNQGFCCTGACLDGCSTCQADAGCKPLPDGPVADAGAACPLGLGYCSHGSCCSTPCLGACAACGGGTCSPVEFMECGLGYMCDGTSLDCPSHCTADFNCQSPTYYCSPQQTCDYDPCNNCFSLGQCCTPAHQCFIPPMGQQCVF